MHTRVGIVLALLAVPLFAQTVTLTATAVTPLVARVSEGGQTNGASLAAF